MKIARILPVVLVPLLVVLASCGGGGGNGGAKNATLTGSVAGTTVVVYDSGGAKVAEAVATGTSGKSFSVTLPVRRTYAIFLVENAGTASQRVYPLYSDASLTTNLFAFDEPGTIDLGFVDTCSGNAIPTKNPLFANGGSGGGLTTTLPAGLTTAGTVFSSSDLVGTWSLHALGVTPLAVSWTRGKISVAADGTANFTELESRLPIGPQPPFAMTVTPGGGVRFAGTDFRGVMSGSKDLIVWNMSSSLGQALGFLQRQGTSSAASAEGAYQFHQLKGLGPGDAVPGRTSWARGRIQVASDYRFFAPSDLFQTSDPDHNSAASYRGQFLIAADGTVVMSGNPTLHGTMSSDAQTLVATATDQGEQVLMVLQRTGAGFVPADLVATWNFRQLEFWPGTLGQWTYGKATVDANLMATTFEVAPSPGPNDPVPIAITGEGLITLTGDPSFRGALSTDKSLIVGTTSVDSGRTAQLTVLQK